MSHYQNENEDDYSDMPELIDDYMPELIYLEIEVEYAYEEDKEMPKLIHSDRIGLDTDYEDD